MKEPKVVPHTFSYLRYESPEELAAADRALYERALEATARSYAPYSHFRVGVAARLESGAIRTATNQESEVLPSGMCAERILLYGLQSEGLEDCIETMVLVAPDSEAICSPCGACRQVLFDTQKRQGTPIRLLMCSSQEVVELSGVDDLLPFVFEL